MNFRVLQIVVIILLFTGAFPAPGGQLLFGKSLAVASAQKTYAPAKKDAACGLVQDKPSYKKKFRSRATECSFAPVPNTVSANYSYASCNMAFIFSPPLLWDLKSNGERGPPASL